MCGTIVGTSNENPTENVETTGNAIVIESAITVICTRKKNTHVVSYRCHSLALDCDSYA